MLIIAWSKAVPVTEVDLVMLLTYLVLNCVLVSSFLLLLTIRFFQVKRDISQEVTLKYFYSLPHPVRLLLRMASLNPSHENFEPLPMWRILQGLVLTILWLYAYILYMAGCLIVFHLNKMAIRELITLFCFVVLIFSLSRCFIFAKRYIKQGWSERL